MSESAIDDEAIFGLAGPVSPLSADLEPESVSADGSAAGAPIPFHSVGPNATAAVKYAPTSNHGFSLAVDADRAADRAGKVFDGVLETASIPRHDHGEAVVTSLDFEGYLNALSFDGDSGAAAVIGEGQWATSCNYRPQLVAKARSHRSNAHAVGDDLDFAATIIDIYLG